jgi:Transposase DDE domain group 1
VSRRVSTTTEAFALPEHTTTECQLFPDFFRKAVVARFDQYHGSSDGGAVLLRAADLRLQLTGRLGEGLRDGRDPRKVRHEIAELLCQRVFAIACGYPDGNDAARLANDPIHKLLVGRDPLAGDALASQPTLSRFENRMSRGSLYRMGEALADVVIARHRKRLRGRARRVTIDLDTTADPTHGQQQLSFFSGYHDTWCYLPMVGFLTFDDEPEQYLFTAVLRAGNAPDKCGVVAILGRLLRRLRLAFPRARFCVRLDAGFAAPDIFAFLEAQADVDYVVAMPKNPVLLRLIKRLMARARRLARESAQTAQVYGECRYAARTWPAKRRVIVKAEVVRHPGREAKENPRFVVTNLRQTPKWIYERVYCERGDSENRIKELHLGLEMDRTSCSSFRANQFRVLITAAAFVLMQELRLRAARTSCARAQVQTLRERLIKIGVRVVESVRRVVLHFPAATAYLPAWKHVALSFARPSG